MSGLCFVMIFTLCIMYIVTVGSWDDSKPGRCYKYLARENGWSITSKGIHSDPITRDRLYFGLFLALDFICAVEAIYIGWWDAQGAHIPAFNRATLLCLLWVTCVDHYL
ncbi:hypothetical protein BCR34DRAFT_142543 [Clohesyomyces aquaticus]|uniref:Uncharacterized protein n=1 Tax=Clohesyomyces aquaticus TaxID=1231657 RepID=A0A1Y1YLK6_9PLEO|nr:hypothetical protein BCR34DRAFT_142543 [Clohesyomyces aquaticus]